MHRTDDDANVAGLFDEGDPGVPRLPTQISASWLNDVQEELCNVVENSGQTLVEGTRTQLLSALAGLVGEPGGRLTMASGDPNPVADYNGQIYLNYLPYLHGRISLYDGSVWNLYNLEAYLTMDATDATKSPAASAANKNYDIFIWDDAGTLTLSRGPAWSTDTSRGSGAGTTEIGLFQGRMVNLYAITNGPVGFSGLYVGTVRTDGSANLNDSYVKRNVWNMYNRVQRPLKVVEAANTFSGSNSGAYRAMNNSSSNSVQVVTGLLGSAVDLNVIGIGTSDDAACYLSVGVGIDSTTVNSSSINSYAQVAVASKVFGCTAKFFGFNFGFHTYTAIERATAGTVTWTGDDGGAAGAVQAGMAGHVMG